MARTRLHGAVARRPVAALALLVALAFLTVGAAPAQAGKTLDSILGSTGTGAGQFGNLGGVEVRQSTGQIYVVDRGNHRVQRFAADGTFELMWGRDVKVGGVTTHEVCTAADADTGSGGVGSRAGRRAASPSIRPAETST